MGNVRLYGSTSGYTELAPPAVAPDGVLSLPSGTGTLATTADVAAGGGGLVHINTTTFSAVSSVSIDDVFTSDYANYSIVIEGATGSESLFVAVRMRAAGVDATGASDYKRSWSVITDTSGGDDSSFSSTGSSYGVLSSVPSGASFANICTFYTPQIAQKTLMSSVLVTSQMVQGTIGFAHNLSTSYDGLTIYPNTGNLTGTIRVYGYKNGA